VRSAAVSFKAAPRASVARLDLRIAAMSLTDPEPPPPDPARGEITRLLLAYHEGNQEAFQQLTSLVYDELRRIARRRIARGGAGETLNATALVHETYLRLIDERGVEWQGRAHFFAIASRSMRRIIIDHARERQARKRGGGQPHVELDPERVAVVQQADTLLAIDAALAAMSAIDERLVRVAECRLFGGLSEEETAQALAISLRTVQRDWHRARAWLQREMPR
jgi:RNA polymerase sigma-70 factor, ECF subfamily